jgi:hypothetical protein
LAIKILLKTSFLLDFSHIKGKNAHNRNVKGGNDMTDPAKRKAMNQKHPRSHPADLDQFGRDGEIPVINQQDLYELMEDADQKEHTRD